MAQRQASERQREVQGGGLTMRLAHGKRAPRGVEGVRLGDLGGRYPLTALKTGSTEDRSGKTKICKYLLGQYVVKACFEPFLAY